jgi:hypothetical protein
MSAGGRGRWAIDICGSVLAHGANGKLRLIRRSEFSGENHVEVRPEFIRQNGASYDSPARDRQDDGIL